MSVINKMLKDLEQRQEPEVPLGTSGATYQPPSSNKSSGLLLTLVGAVVLLIAAVAWLLLDKNGTENVAATPQITVANSNPAVVAGEKQPIKDNLNDDLNEDPNDDLNDNQARTSLALAVPEQTAPVLAEPVMSKPAMVTPKTVETNEQVVEPVAPGRISAPIIKPKPPVVKAKSQPVDETSNFASLDRKLKIEKSSTSFTPEQRVANLMSKAQDSFDKGYITESISQLEEVLSSVDSHVDARNLLAVAWYGRGELQQAVNILNDGLSRYPSVEKWRLTAAKIYFKDNQMQGAFSYLEADLTNASVEYYSMKGTLGRQLQLFDKAESAYASLTELEPDNGSWWLGYAIALDSQSKFDLAKESYKTAIAKSGLSSASVNFATQRINELQE